MLNWLLGKRRSADTPKAGPQMAMPAFLDDAPPRADAIVAAWSSLFPAQPALKHDAEPGPDNGPLAFSSDGRMLMLAHMPGPIPWPEVEEACQASWMWPEAVAKLKPHRSHAVCVCIPRPGDAEPGSAAADAMALSRLIAAALRAGKSAGVYWGNAGVCHSPEMFIRIVQEADDNEPPPVMLWVGLRISAPGPNGPFTLTTRGLGPLGHKEFEVIDTRMRIGDLRILAYDVSTYVLSAGPVLLHGQTFGRTADERMRIEHTRSRFRRGEDVIRLHIP